jgi:hypothetical protein
MIKVMKIVQHLFFFQYLKPNDAKNLVDCFVSCKRKTKSNKIIDSKDVVLKVRKFQKHIFSPSILLKNERKKPGLIWVYPLNLVKLNDEK